MFLISLEITLIRGEGLEKTIKYYRLKLETRETFEA
jgi:hypothetical protein